MTQQCATFYAATERANVAKHDEGTLLYNITRTMRLKTYESRCHYTQRLNESIFKMMGAFRKRLQNAARTKTDAMRCHHHRERQELTPLCVVDISIVCDIRTPFVASFEPAAPFGTRKSGLVFSLQTVILLFCRS